MAYPMSHLNLGLTYNKPMLPMVTTVFMRMQSRIGRGQQEELQKLAEEVTIAKAQEREAQRVKERDQRKRMQERDSDKFNVKYWLDILMGS